MIFKTIAVLTVLACASIAQKAEVHDGTNLAVETTKESMGEKRNVKACWKDSEPRGRGHVPDQESKECPENQEKSMGLCYPKCGPKRIGWGPLCLDDCQATVFKSNAAFFCCDSDETCEELMQNAATKLPRALVRFAIDLAAHPSDARRLAHDFREFLADAMQLRLPLCSKMEEDGSYAVMMPHELTAPNEDEPETPKHEANAEAEGATHEFEPSTEIQ